MYIVTIIIPSQKYKFITKETNTSDKFSCYTLKDLQYSPTACVIPWWIYAIVVIGSGCDSMRNKKPLLAAFAGMFIWG